MKTIYRPRNSGKTTLLADMVRNDPNGLLVCFAQEEAKRVALHHQLPPEKVTSWGLLETAVVGRRCNLYIDNVDLILGRMFAGCQVKAVSASEQEEPVPV